MNNPSAAIALLFSMVLESGKRWGKVATDWQIADALAILEPGRKARLHFLTRPRGGSKTSDLAAIVLAALIEQIPPGGRCYAVAADRDQARLLVDAIAGFVARTPGLAAVVEVDRYKVTTANGATLEVIPADAPSAYGLRGHLFVADEMAQWTSTARDVWVAIVSAVPKVPGARLVAASTAGDPAHWSHTIRERARRSRSWRLNEVPGPVPWVKAAALEEQRALLTDSQFARLHLNQWTASEDRLVDVHGIEEAMRLDGPQPPRRGVIYRMGVDLGIRNDRTAVAVVHGERAADGMQRRVVLDRLLAFEGSKEDEVALSEVEAAIVELWTAYRRPRIRLDPWQGIGLAQRLRRRGVTVEEWSYSARRYGAMASVLFALLRDGNLDLYPAPGLADELANIRLTETAVPGTLRIDHDSDRHDDMTVAMGMAVLAVMEQPGGVGKLHVPVGRIPEPRLTIRRDDHQGPIPVVKDGQTPDTGHYPAGVGPLRQFGRLRIPRNHPGYRPPGQR